MRTQLLNVCGQEHQTYVIKEYIKRLGPFDIKMPFSNMKLRLKRTYPAQRLSKAPNVTGVFLKENIAVMLLVDACTGEILDANHAACSF